MESLPLRAGRVECIPDIEHDMLEQTLAIIASMMQQAAHDATLYCAEAKRIVVMPRDIELALKRLVLPGSAYWTRDDLSEEAQQIRHRLFVDASSEESDSGDSWVTDVGGEWSETAESDLTRECFWPRDAGFIRIRYITHHPRTNSDEVPICHKGCIRNFESARASACSRRTK
jgi:histone H3/H4